MKVRYGRDSITLEPENEFEIAFIKQFTCNPLVKGAWCNGHVGEVGRSILHITPKHYSEEEIITRFSKQIEQAKRQEELIQRKSEERIRRRESKKKQGINS